MRLPTPRIIAIAYPHRCIVPRGRVTGVLARPVLHWRTIIPKEMGNGSQRRLRLFHGCREGKLLHVSQVSSGLKCGCVCPGCGDRLVAKKGRVREHHFAHAAGSDCPTAVETALHLAAKEILSKRKEIVLPRVGIGFRTYGSRTQIYSDIREGPNSPDRVFAAEERYPLTSVALEQRLGDIIPDVIAYVEDRPLFIEVRVTHGIDDEKLERIKRLNISTVEIDLSEAPRNLLWGELEELVVESGDHKRWAYNAFAERQRKRIVSQATDRPVFEIGSMITRTAVKGCPRPRFDKPYWVNGKPYPTVLYDCASCKHFLDYFKNNDDVSGVLCDA